MKPIYLATYEMAQDEKQLLKQKNVIVSVILRIGDAHAWMNTLNYTVN